MVQKAIGRLSGHGFSPERRKERSLEGSEVDSLGQIRVLSSHPA